tara:strand:+ start:1699 stop:2760 length:1062 start_codon:yes stop_codon:yes gene_type:complete
MRLKIYIVSLLKNKIILSLMLAFSSILNFTNFIFIPKFVGLESLDSFYEANLYPSALNLLLSPVLPIIAKNKVKLLAEFLIILTLYFTVFCLTNLTTGVGNLLWVLFGLCNLIIFFKSKELEFIIYTLLNSLIFMGLILLFDDYIISFLLTGCISLLIILLRHHNDIFNFFTKISFPKLSNFNFFLRPFFSLSTFWLLFLMYIEFYQRNDLVLYNYYQKIAVSIPVALFSYFSLDALKVMKLELKKYLKLTILLAIAVLTCCLLVNNIITGVNLNIFVALLLGLFSILPLVSFNLIADIPKFRIIWVLLVGLFTIGLFAGNILFTNFSLIILFISFSTLSLVIYKKNILDENK